MSSSLLKYRVLLTLALLNIGYVSNGSDAPLKITPGEPLFLTCDPPNIAEDSSKVEWIKDGEDDNILISDDKYTVFENRTLLISQAEPDDAGTYECRTTSSQPLTKHFSVFFFNLKDLPATKEVIKGSNIELKCMAEGKPIPTVQWLKDGKKLNDSKYDYAANEHYISNAVLSFANVQEQDTGIYTCQVFSDMGIYNTSTTVNIQKDSATKRADGTNNSNNNNKDNGCGNLHLSLSVIVTALMVLVT